MNRIIMKIKRIVWDERGIGTVEMVMILCILVGLLIIFKGKIGDVMSTVFDEMEQQIQGVYK